MNGNKKGPVDRGVIDGDVLSEGGLWSGCLFIERMGRIWALA
jgi:hypothetical protein